MTGGVPSKRRVRDEHLQQEHDSASHRTAVYDGSSIRVVDFTTTDERSLNLRVNED